MAIEAVQNRTRAKTWSGSLEDLRDFLEARLRARIPDEEWEQLQGSDERWIPEAYATLQGRNDLLRHLRRQKRMWLMANRPQIAGRPPKETQNEAGAGLLTQLERSRTEVISNYVARLARRDSAAANLWVSHFGGGPLAPVDAKRILISPAAASLPRSWFGSLDDVLKPAELIREVRTPAQWRRTLRVGHQRVAITNPDSAKGDEAVAGLTGFAQGLLRLMLNTPREVTLRVEVPSGDGFTDHEVQVWPGSFLDDIGRMAAELAKDYGWRVDAAAWFVLTGAAPQVWPFSFSIEAPSAPKGYRGVRAALSIDPWVSSSSVQRIYKWLQEYAGRKGGKPVTEKGLRVFDFVSERRLVSAKVPTWNQVLAEWNQAYPAERYDSYRRIWETYVNAERALVVPPFDVANNPTEEEK